MPGPIDNFVMWLLGGAASALATVGLPVGKVVKDNRQRSRRNQRLLEGDPQDPNSEGVLQIAYDTRGRVASLDEKVDDVRREIRREHETVMDRLDRMDPDEEG